MLFDVTWRHNSLYDVMRYLMYGILYRNRCQCITVGCRRVWGMMWVSEPHRDLFQSHNLELSVRMTSWPCPGLLRSWLWPVWGSQWSVWRSQRSEALNDQFEALNDQFEGLNDQFDGLNDQFEARNDQLEALNDQFEGLNDQFEARNDQFGALTNWFFRLTMTNLSQYVQNKAYRLTSLLHCI